ncbi:Envelope fusion protein [Aphis craccivora]|uniref:Envelope fusion protein n=1 Tax=Aphis craccivora TaxID=307492 RepID=A0A6G0ZER3_APHCR|nr:Envelope fusion protein [Aphis craccivora]
MFSTNKSIKFIIMDFEFGMLYRTSIVLISGVMSNSLDQSRAIKIEEKPLLLMKGNNNQTFYLQLKNMKTKQTIVSEEIGHVDKKGHSRISKKGIPYKTISKAAQILFGLCDRFCVQKTNADFSKLTDSNNTEVNILEKQVKVIKLDRDKGPVVQDRVNVINDLKKLRNMTSEINKRSFLVYHFIQTNLILELYLAEINILFDFLQTANIGLIHPRLLTPRELLYKYLAVNKSKEMYSTYDEIDQSFCKHFSDFLICLEIYPLHNRNERLTCEVLLLQEPKGVPDSCEIMQLTRHVPLIRHKKEADTEYIELISNSKIKEPKNSASLMTNIFKNKHARTNQMFDLNVVAKSISKIKEMATCKDVKTEKIINSKSRHTTY